MGGGQLGKVGQESEHLGSRRRANWWRCLRSSELAGDGRVHWIVARTKCNAEKSLFGEGVVITSDEHQES